MKQSEAMKIRRILETARAAIFDVDGTLLDSMDIWRDAGEKYLNHLNIQAEPKLGDKLFAMSLEEAADYLIENYHLRDSRNDIIRQVIEIIEGEYFHVIPLKPCVKEFLDVLRKNNIIMAVATTSERNVVETALRRLGILDYFGKIFTCSEVGAGKDKPDIYLAAADFLKCSPHEIWVFEDAPHAAGTAVNAGFHVVGIYDKSSGDRQKELKDIVDIYIKDFGELMEQGEYMTVTKDIVPEYDKDNLIRLNKYLSDAGVCSRRQADKLIEEGRVTVNGRPAVTGMKVDRNWEILCDGRPAVTEEEFILLAFHKPRGVECTTSHEVRNNIVDYIGYEKRIYPVGRLDRDSEGLILMTNNGAVVNKILKASNYHEKEYEVTIDRKVDEEFIRKMSNGVKISKTEMVNGKKQVVFEAVTRKCKVRRTGEKSFRIILTQGLNRQIRRMCQACGARVITLKRIRIMNILLGDLKAGEYREVTEEELKDLLEHV